jgi:hypothetical protein
MMTNQSEAPGDTVADRWAPTSDSLMDLKINPKPISSAGKLDRNGQKNPGTILEVVNPIYNIFHYCNFFQIFMNFELFKRY